MIKNNELKIGSYVAVHDYVKLNRVEDKPNTYDPIEITKEILESAGFEKADENRHVDFYDKSCGEDIFRVGLHKGHNTVMLFWNLANIRCWNGLNVCHLHHLQLVYFSLTGVELDVEF